MADAVNAYEATLVGNLLPGGDKWSGGVLAADGNIYGIPYDATQVLRFDPRTQQATHVGDQLPGDPSKWCGGVLADGNIYGIPCDATQVLRLLTDKPPAATTADADHYVAIVQAARGSHGQAWRCVDHKRVCP